MDSRDHRVPLAVLAGLALASCRSDKSPAADAGATDSAPAAVASAAPSAVTVIASDYSFDAPAEVPAGLTTFKLVNRGPSIHHVQLVKLNEGKTFDDFTAALKEQGFGVLTEIDVRATLKKKLNVDFRPYVILGACNPPLAYRALQTERELGLLLPCNVIVYDNGDGTSTISAIDPLQMVSVTNNPDLDPIAADANARLLAALARV